jgi:DNA-binding GntR family transcriptional regulator
MLRTDGRKGGEALERGLSLAEQAYDSLKRDIIRCRLRPGEVIIEAHLAAEYGMSKTPVREAINLLRREGLVLVVPRKGTFVKPIDVRDVQDTYRLRQLLEPEAAVLASKRAGPDELRRLEDLCDATCTPDSDPADQNEANRLLHVAIAEAAGVPMMAKMINSLHEEVERFLNHEQTLRHASHGSEFHKELLDAIRNGPEDHVRAIVVEGIQLSQRRMIEALLTSHSGESPVSATRRS